MSNAEHGRGYDSCAHCCVCSARLAPRSPRQLSAANYTLAVHGLPRAVGVRQSALRDFFSTWGEVRRQQQKIQPEQQQQQEEEEKEEESIQYSSSSSSRETDSS